MTAEASAKAIEQLGVKNAQSDKVRDVFKSFDTSNTGVISKDELSEVLTRLMPGVTATQIDEMFRAADLNRDGSIDYDEFVNWIWNSGGGVPEAWGWPKEPFEYGELRVHVEEYTKAAEEERAVQAGVRAELMQRMFQNVVDVENLFHCILTHLSPHDHKEINHRVGILNIFNPLQPQCSLDLALDVPDQRKVASILMHLNSHEELDAIVQYWEKLQPQCVAKPEPYEERKKRREEEIAGLKEAMEILEAESAPAFLQRLLEEQGAQKKRKRIVK